MQEAPERLRMLMQEHKNAGMQELQEVNASRLLEMQEEA
jgi:hypothetical protein